MKKIYSEILLLCLTLNTLFFSCNKDSETMISDEANDIILSDFNGDAKSVLAKKQLWHCTNKKILVVLGYDFNVYPISDNLINILSERFGLAEDGGLISYVIYPEGFKHNGRFFASDLFAVIDDFQHDLAGIVILGAPENTHIALARVQDLWGDEIPYPVVALFPQDDVLGIESTCDFILEKKNNDSIKVDTNLTEENSDFFEDAPTVISNIINYIFESEGCYERDSSLLVHVNQALKNNTVRHYVDPESGIPSINHFVLN